MVDRRHKNELKLCKTEGMPDERTIGLPKEWRPPKHREPQKFLVSEIYSPLMITAEVRQRKYKHLGSGIAFDLTVNDPDDGQARELLEVRQEGEGKEDPQVIQALLIHWVTHVHRIELGRG